MKRRHKLATVLTAAVSLLVAGTPGSAVADDHLSHNRSALEDQLQATAKQREGLQSALEDLSGELVQAQADLQGIQAQIPAAQAKLTEATAVLDTALRAQQQIAVQLTDARQQRTRITAQAAEAADDQQRLRQEVAAMARAAYRNGGDLSTFSRLLEASSSDDFVDSYAMTAAAQRVQGQVLDQMRQAQADARNQGARLDAVQRTISSLKQQADLKVAEADQARQDAAAAKARLDDLEQDQQAKQAAVRGQMAEAQRQADEADASTATMQAQLQQVIDAQRQQAAARKSTTTPGTAIAAALFANPTATNPMYVTSEYGMRLQPVLGIYRLHAGIDLRDRCNQPVYAGRDGTVVWSKYLSGYGNQVMVDHGWVESKSLMSSYSHLTTYVVAPGEQVKAGQLVGYAGQTGGTSTACHLHFEVYIDGSTVNPRPYLGLPPA
jgi:murein DD-endopeptidase MepM/ murein hydrolase activator NlpD